MTQHKPHIVLVIHKHIVNHHDNIMVMYMTCQTKHLIFLCVSSELCQVSRQDDKSTNFDVNNFESYF